MKAEIKSLTGIRGIAAVSVMVYHLKMHPIFASYTVGFLDRAYLSVDLFFVLSGFIIAFIYKDVFLEKKPDASAYGKFLLNRMARVWPLSLALTLIFSLRFLLNVSGDAGYQLTFSDFIANVFMYQAWGFGTVALVGTSWSVSTEVLAYILFPVLLLFAFSRFFWVQVVLAVSGLFLVAMSPLGAGGEMDVVSSDSFLPVVRCLSGFSLGLIAYRATKYEVTRKWLSSNMALVAILLLVAAVFMIPNSDVFIVLLFPFLIINLFHENRLGNQMFGNPVAHYLGVISYSIYLCHPLLRDVPARVAMIAQGRGYDWLVPVFAAVAVISPIIVSHFTYHWIEVKGRNLIRSLTDRWQGKVGQKA